jgi:hypothetical protein
MIESFQVITAFSGIQPLPPFQQSQAVEANFIILFGRAYGLNVRRKVLGINQQTHLWPEASKMIMSEE